MAQFTHTIGLTYKNDAGTVIGTSVAYVDDAEVNLEDTVPAGTTNKQFDLPITVANIKSMVIFSTQDLTLKTNSINAAQETITLKAGKGEIWTVDSVAPLPFAGNITKFFCTNSGLADATFKFRALVHQANP